MVGRLYECVAVGFLSPGFLVYLRNHFMSSSLFLLITFDLFSFVSQSSTVLKRERKKCRARKKWKETTKLQRESNRKTVDKEREERKLAKEGTDRSEKKTWRIKRQQTLPIYMKIAFKLPKHTIYTQITVDFYSVATVY